MIQNGGEDDQRGRNPDPGQVANPSLRILARKSVHPLTESVWDSRGIGPSMDFPAREKRRRRVWRERVGNAGA